MRFRLAALLCLMLPAATFAKPPPGTSLTGAEHLWWECNVQPDTGTICCSEADGHVLSDEDWQQVPATATVPVHYQVRVDGKWWDVPPGKVVNETRKCGPEPNLDHRSMAKLWYAPDWADGNVLVGIRIYCFEAGTEY